MAQQLLPQFIGGSYDPDSGNLIRGTSQQAESGRYIPSSERQAAQMEDAVNAPPERVIDTLPMLPQPPAPLAPPPIPRQPVTRLRAVGGLPPAFARRLANHFLTTGRPHLAERIMPNASP